MESEYRGMTTNEVMIEQIKAGHISFADIADYLNDRTDAERNDFCFRMFCSIPMEPITISMESFRDYDAIPYSEEHRPSYHEVKSMNLTPQQELEKDRLLNAIGFIESKYGVDLFSEYQDERTIKPIDDAKELAQCECSELPKELQSDDAKKFFAKAIDLGLMSESYEWKKGLQLLACFAREMSLHLNMGKGYNADGTKRISWKPFEILFDITRNKLRSNYNDIQKTGQNPSDIDLIDKVFE